MADKEIASFGSELGGKVVIYADTVTGLVTNIGTPSGTVAVGGGTAASGAIARTTAQLAGTPSSADVALGAGGQFYDPAQTVDATHPWVYYSASATAYVKLGGGAATGTATPQPLGTAAAGSASAASREDHVHALPTPAQINALALPLDWDPAANNAPHIASGVAPTGNNSYRVATAGTTALTPSIDGIVSVSQDDVLYFDGTTNTWKLIGYGNIGVVTTSVLKGNGAGSALAATPGIDYRPGNLMNSGVPIGTAPPGKVGANGALTLGVYGGGTASLTFSTATAGAGVTCTSAANPFVSTDVGQVITLDGGKQFTITAYTNAGSITGTIGTTLSGTSGFTDWYKGYPFGVATAAAAYTPYTTGAWVYYPAGAVYSASPQGFYWTVMSTTTGGTVYSNFIATTAGSANVTAGSYAAPATPTALSGTTGTNYTPTIGSFIYAPAVAVAGGVIGKGGSLMARSSISNNNSSNNKQAWLGMGSSFFHTAGATTLTRSGNVTNTMNRGMQNAQITVNETSIALTPSAVDTSANQLLQMAFKVNTSTLDWVMLETIQVTLDSQP